MDPLTAGLLLSALGVGVIHTALGVDHYLPLLMLARARRWSRVKTSLVAVACGTVHVAASVALGLLVGGFGLAGTRLELFERLRGRAALTLLIAFGLAYGLWGLRRGLRHSRGLKPHAHGAHVHIHARGLANHEHERSHRDSPSAITFWTLFMVFVLGPCEPLVPLVAVPLSQGSWATACLIAGLFGAATVGTMVALTVCGLVGLERSPLHRIERWSDALAGALVATCGVVVLIFGL